MLLGVAHLNKILLVLRLCILHCFTHAQSESVALINDVRWIQLWEFSPELWYSHRNDLFTYLSAPSRAPENVHVKLLDHNGVEVTWDPLEAKYANGKLLGYKVQIREWKSHYEWWYNDGDVGDVIRVNSTDTHLTLENLDGGRKYQIAVAAFTVDDGPKSDWETVIIGKQEINSLLHYIDEQ